MNISYEHYRIFYFVAKYGSFTRAAEILMNSQPNITRSVKTLERELGCQLFVRTKRNVKLTAEGEMLYRRASVAFEQLRAGEEEIANVRGLQGGTLRIAATEVALHSILLPVLKDFHGKYPNVHIRLINGTSPSAVEEMHNGSADIAVVTGPVTVPENSEKTEIMRFREKAVCGSKYIKNFEGRKVLLKELIEYPIISLGAQTGTYRFYTDVFSSKKIAFEPDIEASVADQILPLVKAGLGIGFMPETMLPVNNDGTFFLIDLKDELPMRSVYMLTSPRKSEATVAFERILLDKKTGEEKIK